MGIEATGDPFWFESLDDDRLRAVYGMLWAEDEEAREMSDELTAPRRRPRRPHGRPVDPPPPPGATASGWAALMSMRSDRQ